MRMKRARMNDSSNIYWRFVRFLFPLAITLVVVEFGIQVLSAGMARVPRATETLAAYGVAWGLILLFTSPAIHAKTLSLVMADSEEACRRILHVVVIFGLLLMGGLAALALTPFSYWAIEEVHDISDALGATVRFALLWLIPAPLLMGLTKYYTGRLLRAKRTVTVSVANVVSIGAGIVLVFALLPTQLIQERPIWLPILATYLNLLVELAVVFWGARQIRFGVTSRAESRAVPTYGEIVRFVWPLSLNISFQEFSRPLINMFIARGPNGLEALAVLTVAYALGQFPYRWLNDLRNFATAFEDEPDYLRHTYHFSLACGVVSLAMMLGLFWTPLADTILLQFMGLEADFARLCRVPLMIFAVFSPIVVLRSYNQGIALVQKRTHLILYCAPPRLVAVWLTLITLPLVGIVGAPLGVSALAVGFFVEALTIWVGVNGVKVKGRQQVSSTL